MTRTFRRSAAALLLATTVIGAASASAEPWRLGEAAELPDWLTVSGSYRVRYESLNKNQVVGDFRFIVIEKTMSNDNDFPVMEKLVLDSYDVLKRMSMSEAKAYGLDGSNVVVEKFPLVVAPTKDIKLKRIE